MAETDAEKTEYPTPRRLSEAREDGNVARSNDLTAAVSLLASVLLLGWIGPRLLMGLKVILQAMLVTAHAPNAARPTDVVRLPAFTGYLLASSVVPLILGMTVVGLIATVAQVGLMVSAKPLEIDLTKLSPIKGLGNLLGIRGWTRLVMSVIKVGIIVGAAIGWVYVRRQQMIHLTELPLMPSLAMMGTLVYDVALRLALVLLVMAILDYAYQRWQHIKDLRMTKQEVKEEMKRMDGDPLMKQRRTRVARQLAMQRMGQAVPKADVIVTNPTHFAVALQYDDQTMQSPKVIAKGADFMALQIRQIAMQNDVPLVERKDLARGLYHTVEVGQEVPPKFYAAVAEILAYVYRLNGRQRRNRKRSQTSNPGHSVLMT